ncbi:uncharacterized protein LOC127481927 isoform X1 [Manacus candei]|uniref:uncharacterized protein LOC127481927 isoform X1 n=1 Tax=Manacus candei TaxID=415023 RepID=UPI0022270634|nr:uncharacterized protein LOC127481927 isoform X1 [Manacus candei]
MSRAGFQGGIHLVSVRNHPEALASFFPSVAVDVLDTSRRTNPVAFMSNVLCACRKWAGTRELAPTRPRIRAGSAQGTTSTSERGRAPSCPPLANWDRVTSACSWLEFPLALGFLSTGRGSWPESFKPGEQWPSHHPCSPSRAGCCPSAPDRSLARGFPWCGGELCFLLGERTALGSCSMSHSCAEPGSLSRGSATF